MEKIYIVDASGYLYSSYFAIRNMTNSKGESTNALFGFVRGVLKIIKDFHPSHLVAVFDGPHNAKSREAIFPEYKGHRAAAPQDLPYQIEWAREFCAHMGIPFLNIPEVEADDTMGSIAVWAEKQGATTYLCTSDKDLCQIVSERIFLLNTRKDNLVIGPAEVEQIHGVLPSQMVDYLAMIGDTSDNVPGLPGIGPKTASALLKQFGSLDNLLAHPEEIVGDKKRAAVVDNTEKARLSRQLVTLDLKLDIPHDQKFYALKAPELPQLKAFYSTMSFHSLLKELDTMPVANESKHAEQMQFQLGGEKLEYHLIDDEQGLHDLVARLSKSTEICFTTESTQPQPIKAELVGLTFSISPQAAWYIPANGHLGLERVLTILKPFFENASLQFYSHNVKHHYQVLANYDIHIATICFDTNLASYLLNSHNRQHSLDALLLQYFGKVKSPKSDLIGKGKKMISIGQVSVQALCPYCCEDADYIVRLKTILQQQIKERHLGKLLYELELPLLKILAKMERYGIFLDIPCLQKQSHIIEGKIELCEKQIYAMAGETFNLNSPKQLSHILQDKLNIVLPKKTATGFSTNADILEALQEQYPIAGLILEYRTLEKLRSTYLDSLPQEVNPKTHRIHCTFNQTVAATGRLSCQDPNLQNIPIRSDEGKRIREAFRPEKPHWSYLAADYSQIELRLLAHLSGDPSLIQSFNNHEDIHAATAATIFNIPLESVTKEMRFHAKAVNFGIVYGQQAFGLSQELKIDVKSAGTFIDTYFKRYPYVKEFIETCKDKARKTGKAVTITGRERLIPEINSKNGQLRLLAERLAMNTPLQGTAADLIKIAMLRIDEKLSSKLKGYMILQIHDELIFELPDEEVEVIKPIVKETMEGVFDLKVPLIVDITIGKNWKEC